MSVGTHLSKNCDFMHLGLVDQRADSAIQRINRYPADKC